MADAGLCEHQVNAFPMLARSETLTKRHVDRTRKLDPGACASQPIPNTLAQARIIAGLSPHVYLRSLHAGDSGWSIVHVQVGVWRVQSPSLFSEQVRGLHILAVACRRCGRSKRSSVSPKHQISSEVPTSHKRRNRDRRNL